MIALSVAVVFCLPLLALLLWAVWERDGRG